MYSPLSDTRISRILFSSTLTVTVIFFLKEKAQTAFVYSPGAIRMSASSVSPCSPPVATA